MAMIKTAQAAPFGAITAHRVISRVTNVAENVSTWVQNRLDAASTAQQLSRLSPQMLADIGLSDADVVRFREEARFF